MSEPKLGLAEIRKRLEELPQYEIFFEGDGDGIFCDFVKDIPRMLSTLQAALTLADAATRLVATLPRCSSCPHAATRAWVPGDVLYCDDCTPEGCAEYPHASPLRDTVAALAGLKET